jgi:sulfate adenylyltransferase subunit 1 (EFTu-like GTPase family)
MDLVNFDQAVYDKIVADFQAFAKGLDNLPNVTPIPMSALNGDNVVDKSEATPWYTGPSLLQHLETVQVHTETAADEARFAVQWVIRPISDRRTPSSAICTTTAASPAAWPAAPSAWAMKCSSIRPR